ncbi:hypothetical protein HBA54_13580 [Pelagibius litoralis]|uniref:Uncharacterized protein n=1 Tax=Pelagibius litoralis TaxID=374515 RepID=A0A967K931_9PROT|nr:hypothetical protein [Pelagibius litoralis]NIA69627.1 hypothetical protein [Pelagibius litoralis]
MRVLFALLLAVVFALPRAGFAQSGETADAGADTRVDPAAVHAAFVKLVDRGEMREQLFGLPADTFWRRSGGLRIALLADGADRLTPSLERVMAVFSQATGQAISMVDSGPSPSADQAAAGLAPAADLVIAIGPRLALAEIAFAEKFDLGMLARFELGTLPFMFSFAEGDGRRGMVLLADDEPPLAREASLILATVWALGGVTLGPELTGLISNDTETGPGLTPLGEAVFALFFNEQLAVGVPIEDTVLRARSVLAE